MHAMGHSDEKLTTRVYTNAFRLNMGSRLASLPSLFGPIVMSAIASGKSKSEGKGPPLGETLKPLTLEA